MSLQPFQFDNRWVALALWALLYALFFALTGSGFFFGGIISIFLLFTRYSRRGNRLRRQLEKQQSKVQESEVETP